jgi:hypothetical protein
MRDGSRKLDEKAPRQVRPLPRAPNLVRSKKILGQKKFKAQIFFNKAQKKFHQNLRPQLKSPL